MRNDFLLDASLGDVAIADGDFVIGESTGQEVANLIRWRQGSVKQYPRTGVGEHRLLNGQLDGPMRREIQLQLEADGIRLKTLENSPTGLKIEYEAN